MLNDAEEQEPELDLRVLLEDDWALLGLRLGALPLHRRAYKVASRPGSLKPPVAYCLGLLAALAPGDVVLDPACGAGTILVEAAALVSVRRRSVGGDIDESRARDCPGEPPGRRAACVRVLIAASALGFELRAGSATTASSRRAAGAMLLYQGDATELPSGRSRGRCGAVEPAVGQAGDGRDRSGAAVPRHPDDDRARAGHPAVARCC